MLKLQDNIIKFATGDIEFFDFFEDYWNHYCDKNDIGKKRSYSTECDLVTKETKMSKLMRAKILERANVPYAHEDNVSEWFTNPIIRHEVFAVVGALIDAVLPRTIIDSIGLYTEVRTIGFGDSAYFDIEPRDLFIVSLGGRAQRTSQIHRHYRGQVAIIPENHIMTVGTFLYKVLSGQESLAALVIKAIRSIETEMTLDAYNVFAAAMAALDNTTSTGLRVAGYSQSSLIRLCQQVSAWNGGTKPVIVGTKLALANVLPNDANYRYTLGDEYATLGFVRTAFGYDVMEIPQVANFETEFDLAISNDYIWILSPSSDKLLKMVIEGSTLSFSDGMWDNANLTQNATFQKSWGVAVGTNAVAGVITLS